MSRLSVPAGPLQEDSKTTWSRARCSEVWKRQSRGPALGRPRHHDTRVTSAFHDLLLGLLSTGKQSQDPECREGLENNVLRVQICRGNKARSLCPGRGSHALRALKPGGDAEGLLQNFQKELWVVLHPQDKHHTLELFQYDLANQIFLFPSENTLFYSDTFKQTGFLFVCSC